jgi:hypothetical protein
MRAMKRIHIVGCAPRSGTTLMAELLVNGFAVDGYAEHELSVFARPRQRFEVFVSKNPKDIHAVRPLLALDGNLWVIYLLRDPRDVIVSRHRKVPDKYYANLRIWKERQRVARRLREHPRFMTVRYEDLVADPDREQERLMLAMPFLTRRAAFAEYHRHANPSAHSIAALGGVRPVGTESIGRWREHKPRVAAQLELHGPITAELIEAGYEKDDRWLRELDGIRPDNHVSRWPERSPALHRLKGWLERAIGTLRYALGL